MNKEAMCLWQRAHKALVVARAIVELDPNAAASRAYYAAFYAVKAYFALEGMDFSKHSAVEAAVHQHLVKPGLLPGEVGQAYSDLEDLRIQGDYTVDNPVTLEMANESIALAEGIVDAVSKIRPDELLKVQPPDDRVV